MSASMQFHGGARRHKCHAQRYVSLFIIAAIAAIILTACAPTSTAPPAAPSSSSAIGLEAPKSFREKLAYGYTLNASVRQGAAAALTAKRIEVDDAKRVLDMTDLARHALDEARRLEQADPSTSLGRVQYAIGLLTAGQTFLRDRGVK